MTLNRANFIKSITIFINLHVVENYFKAELHYSQIYLRKIAFDRMLLMLFFVLNRLGCRDI